MWGGDNISPKRIAEATSLLMFIRDYNLHSLLLRGTPIFWSVNKPGTRSTLDLTLSNIPTQLLKCQIYPESYGSDHRATYSEWDLSPQRLDQAPTRRLYQNTDWEEVGKRLHTELNLPDQITHAEQLDEEVGKFINTVSTIVNDLTPTANPCPYSKRWFTPELKRQQKEHNKLRRAWQSGCTTRGKDHPITISQFMTMQKSKREWSRAIEKAKASHWRDFLDGARNGNLLWKAARYTKPGDSYSNIPLLKTGDGEAREDEDKATLFLNTFFPQPASHETPNEGHPPLQIPWNPITENEIQRSLERAKGASAPGGDGLPMLVWKKIWPSTSTAITKIFRAATALGHHPKAWRRAVIVVLRKPGKPDYTVPNAYRPISLLNTLGKLLESVMARRLTYYAERYNLLPDTQFGGRPGRTTEQALLILTEAIMKAWRKSKVVSLMAFDLKGAFNGVAKGVLDQCLRRKGIPSEVRKWVQSFMTDRWACIKFDGYTSTPTRIRFPGLPQGSPSSPVLFTFFNSALVDQPVNGSGGASAFIDDYFRWRVGNSVDENLKALQEIDTPRIQQWAKAIGSTFEANKTELIHFTRKSNEQRVIPIRMDDMEINPTENVKLLGVIFDRHLKWRAHVQRAVKRAISANLAIGRLRQLRPAQMRQLYQACVVPRMDYASTVWYNPSKNKWQITALNTVQRPAMIKILSAFRTAATQALEVETYLLPTHLRLAQRAKDVVTNLMTLPETHPIARSLNRAIKLRSHPKHTARTPIQRAVKTLSEDQLEAVEAINTCPSPPWQEPPFARICAETDPRAAREEVLRVMQNPDTAIYTDASAKEGNLGAAVVMLDANDTVYRARQITVGPDRKWNVPSAELIAIYYAVDLAIHEQRTSPNPGNRTYTIFTDSRAGLQALANPLRKPGSQITQEINDIARLAKDRYHIHLNLRWIPSHSGIKGNEEADRLAKVSVGQVPNHRFAGLASLQRKVTKDDTLREWTTEWNRSTKGQYLRRIDTTIPGPHVRKLYDHLPRQRAGLLAQLRIGHNWLKTFSKRRKFSDDDRCECGAIETLVHVFIDCPKLREPRRQLRESIGDRFNNLTTMLGSRTQKGCKITAKELDAVLDFAEQSGRFRNRDTEPESTNAG